MFAAVGSSNISSVIQVPGQFVSLYIRKYVLLIAAKWPLPFGPFICETLLEGPAILKEILEAKHCKATLHTCGTFSSYT